jgi:hypothetical protein
VPAASRDQSARRQFMHMSYQSIEHLHLSNYAAVATVRISEECFKMDVSKLIDDDVSSGTFRIHRSTMTSKEIMSLELERIYAPSWLYIGHDSEVPKPGDFCRRTVLGRLLFMNHGSDGKIRILINSCLHRGANVYRADGLTHTPSSEGNWPCTPFDRLAVYVF